MDNIFQFHEELVEKYNTFSQGFNIIREKDIRDIVDKYIREKRRFCPEPLIQLNLNYKEGASVNELVEQNILHPDCGKLFVTGNPPRSLKLYQHQQDAIIYANDRKNYVVTTGTGSGKSLTFIIPIINAVLRSREKSPARRTRAIIIYPMNALANSQEKEFTKYLANAPELGITVGRYTGQELEEDRRKFADNPPDILLTNYMMLEYLLTRSTKETDRKVIANCRDLAFLALDELHTYRGRQGADVALLVRRLRITTHSENMICVGTSATMSTDKDPTVRRKAVANVATKLFGAKFLPDFIIEEQLIRVTDETIQDSKLHALLKEYLENSPSFKWQDDDPEFLSNPLAIWVERNMGVRMQKQGLELERAIPKTLKEHAEKLAKDTGLNEEEAHKKLEEFLQAACSIRIHGRTPFAFKLHQFISGPGNVSVTLEDPGLRHVTLEAQTYDPRSNGKARLFTAYFCRECGQAHIPAWYDNKQQRYTPRSMDDTPINSVCTDSLEACILTPVACGEEMDKDGIGQETPHVFDPDNIIDTLPESWTEEKKDGALHIKSGKREYVPKKVYISVTGEATVNEDATHHAFYRSHYGFPYCVHCGAEFSLQGKAGNRIYGLSVEGRSSASTVLVLTALNQMGKEIRETSDETKRAELRKVYKILGFTDNRQDAALQAGFFNDFVHTALIRAALIRALSDRDEPIDETELIQALQEALEVSLCFDSTSKFSCEQRAFILTNPNAKGMNLKNARRAMDFYLGYSLIMEQRRGWRRNNPNLEQLGVLTISYQDIDEIVEECHIGDDPHIGGKWKKLQHESRVTILTTILDALRRKLCLKCDYLDENEQKVYEKELRKCLTPLWRLPKEGKQKKSSVAILSPGKYDSSESKYQIKVSMSKRSSLAKALYNCLDDGEEKKIWRENFSKEDYPVLIEVLFRVAEDYGLVCSVPHGNTDKQNATNAWRVNSSALLWKCTPEGREHDLQQNDFFLDLYKNMAELLKQTGHGLFEMEAAEHTAQVDNKRRRELEDRFGGDERSRKPGHLPLPVLFCSPTMELGIDISSLDIVYMRNVPPTPANYAQRAGRAGRSGRAALAITYCAAASPHDQWFFHKQSEMVHGIVKPPVMDLSNRDLVDSHLRAIWLHAAKFELNPSIAQILDTEQREKMEVRKEVEKALCAPEVIDKALPVAQALIHSLLDDELNPEGEALIPGDKGYDWIRDPNYCENCLKNAWKDFKDSFEYWRNLLRATRNQIDEYNKINNSTVGYTEQQRTQAKNGYYEAVAQKDSLLGSSPSVINEFYSYRYLASQGFIPGYDFPRLPLLAWIPGSDGGARTSRPLSRPRFLALSEFGPLSLVYHQGDIYQVHKIKFNSQHVRTEEYLPTCEIQMCSKCGHSVLLSPGKTPLDLCESCKEELKYDETHISSLYQVETVETRRIEKIGAREEERQRQGYDLQTCYRFADSNGMLSFSKRKIYLEGSEDKSLGSFTYGSSATLWRVNKGWRRRADANTFGFNINPSTGRWSHNEEAHPDSADDDVEEKEERTHLVQRIVPYVEDHRNILIYQLPGHMQGDASAAATLQAALTVGITRAFQIDSSEIIAEPLPNRSNRKSLLLYEASEGGAGVLHQLVENRERLKQVAEEALHAMHYERVEGEEKWEDLHEHEELSDDQRCVCACYQCLLSYRNQPDHELIDRHNKAVYDLLSDFANGNLHIGEDVENEEAVTLTDSGSSFCRWLESHGLPTPDAVNKSLPGGLVADAYYNAASLALFRVALPENAADELYNERGIVCRCLTECPTRENIDEIKELLK